MNATERITPGLFSIPFGLVGLAGVWRLTARVDDAPPAFSDALLVAAAGLWLLFLAGSLRRLARSPRAVLEDLRDQAVLPFWSLPFVVGMELAVGLQSRADTAARVLFVFFLVATAAFGGWVVGRWIAGELDLRSLHCGYFLPTVAGGFVGAQGAVAFGMPAVGWVSFGIAMVSWVAFGSLILTRLTSIGMLPGALVPTLAIELAPPALAGSDYFLLHGPSPDAFAYAIAGCAVLMALVQVRLLPVYARLTFDQGFWSFVFPWAAAAGLALRWVAIERPPGQAAFAALAAGGVSALTGAIAGRSLLAAARGRYLRPSGAPLRAGTTAVLTTRIETSNHPTTTPWKESQ